VGQWRRSFRVSGSGFWQVHPGAAAALVGAVNQALDPRPGEVALDLYCGVGLFAAALADAVAPDGAGPGRVLAVESDPGAVKDARRNLHDLPAVQILAARVDAALTGGASGDGPVGGRADVVVLDPPRTGAGRKVVHAVAALAPRAIAYVACDPAALGRDIAWFAELGYRLERIRVFDIFPMTHHQECVAHLVPAAER
jgi:tRNA/tmRNA/rRNA uracil-C5-methylase (TrmA/RlmC/RlmD family)